MKLVASALHVAVCPWFGSRKGLRFSKHFELAVDLDERIIANALIDKNEIKASCRIVANSDIVPKPPRGRCRTGVPAALLVGQTLPFDAISD